MKRKLLKQIFNEWRINIWIAIEILIASVVITVAVYDVYVNMRIYYAPMNIDIDRTYLVSYSKVPYTSEDFDQNASIYENSQNYEMLRTIRNHPIVEAAVMAHNCRPYTRGMSTLDLRVDTTKSENLNLRMYGVSPSYPRVFNIRGINGETPEQLEQILKDGKVIISKNLFSEYGVNAADLIGKKIFSEWEEFTVGAVIEPIRWSEYDEYNYNLIHRLSDAMYGYNLELVVRIKPEFTGDVKETIMNEIRSGNNYVTAVESLKDQRKISLREKDNEMRNHIVVVAFLLFNLFLGILGTFWLRTFQRPSAIAIRKVHGASSASIMRRLIGEGLIIVTLASIPAFFISGVIINVLVPEIFTWGDTAICAAFTYIAIAIITLFGTLFPALKAIRINPAEALKSE
ncbi:MAG: ABC transporter permease [Muribaculum sp.]|nr:ABC transporter permease [Muribaculum sp.]